LVGLGFDVTTGRIWGYASVAAAIKSFDENGAPLSTVPRPGESADDVDIEFAPEAMTLGSTLIPKGTLLFIDGETGSADIYAVDKTTGAVLATLVTGFGVSHVVGGAYHAGRNSFFLVQDKVPGAPNGNRIAEVSATSGAVLNTFLVSSFFSVNYGGLDINSANGNLFLGSSDEPRVAEVTPSGRFVQYHALPLGVVSLSGIGFTEACGEAWVGGTRGAVWRLSGFGGGTVFADLNGDSTVDAADLAILLGSFSTDDPVADLDDNETVDGADLGLLLGAWGTGCA